MTENVLDPGPVRTVVEIKVTTAHPEKGYMEHESVSLSNLMPDTTPPNVAYVAREAGQRMSKYIQPVIQETIARQINKVFTDTNETPST